MSKLVGQALGHYRIAEKIGAGGMGVVYRAHDERLDRDVAIKVLPETVARDPERLARFEREAKLLASLSHQNIATLYGLEEHAGERYLVMELVEGETLAERIARGPIPADDSLEIACQIAEGLEAAHGQGIIHRDLKPANVMLSPEDKVKILDFGLAKAWVNELSDVDLTHSPTITAEMTASGALMGTAAYMSPEQARAKRVDKRTDIWAFGSVLYEMLTGNRAFPGEGLSETMAAILKEEPDWNVLPAETPPSIRRLLRRCQKKDPNRRLHDIADARIVIEESGEAEEDISQPLTAVGKKSTARTAAIAVTALLGITAGSFGVNWLTRTTRAPVVAFHIETQEPLFENFGGNSIAVSPDGKHLVYVVSDGDDRNLVHRPMDQFMATQIPGSEGAIEPVFSPDSQSVLFSARGKLKKVSLQGGQPVDLCEGCGGFARWSPTEDEIISVRSGSLWRIPATGGEPTIVLEAAQGSPGYRRPEYLPDGRAVLLEIRSRPNPDPDVSIGLLDLETLELETLIRHGSDPAYAPSGHIVFARQDVLYAVGFDARRRVVTGEPVPVIEGVSAVAGCARFSFSDDGLLAYLQNSGQWENEYPCSVVWVDRQGTPAPLTGRDDSCEDPRLSPDGSRVAMAAKGEIWIYAIRTDTWQLLTTGIEQWAHLPVWTPDGERIVFSLQGRRYLPHSIPADFSGTAELLLDRDSTTHPRSFSPSGELILNEYSAAGRGNIMMLPADSESPRYVVSSEFNEQSPMVSRNGRWLVYSSDRSGVQEIYVEPFPDGGPRTQVSAGGGTEPRWAPGGRELFYRNGAQMIVVPVATDSEFAITGERKTLFENDAYASDAFRTNYDVDQDGQRFLMVQFAENDGERDRINRRLNLVLNWFEELERLVPTK